MPFRDLAKSRGDSLTERYENTMNRIELIARAVYNGKIQGECEFDESKVVEEKPELLTHPIVKHSPLKTRDNLYRGRTEAMRLHYKISENETKQYCDVISHYPFICKYFNFPIGHPNIHIGETCRNVDVCLKMEGLMKCTPVPSKNLYHPFLPYRCDKKLLFCLCR